MELSDSAIGSFLSAARKDPFVGPSHISIYVALLALQEIKGQPMLIFRKEVMCLARIGSQSTYHRVIKDLSKNGYIKYEGKYNRKGNLVTVQV